MAARCAKTCAAKGGCSTRNYYGNVSLWLKNIPKKILLATTLKLDRVRNLTKTTNMAARCAKTCAAKGGCSTLTITGMSLFG